MHIINGGITNGVEYSCMYNANDIAPDIIRTETSGKKLYGFFGIANSLNDAPAIVWLDENLNFVKGEIRKCCTNCYYVGRSGGGFFAECLYFGYQIDNEYNHDCGKFKSKEVF